MRLQKTLEKYVPLISNMLAPAFIFAVALFAFLLNGSLSDQTALICHWGFYAFSFLAFMLMLNFNRSRLLFFVLSTLLAYVLINYLKNKYGVDFQENISYKNLCVLFPFNLLFFYLFQSRHFLSKTSLLFLALIAAEYSVGEFLERFDVCLEYRMSSINWSAAVGYILLILTVFVSSVRHGHLFDYCVLFSCLSLGFGFFFSPQASGLSLFFFIAQLFLMIYIIHMLIYTHFYDENTGFYSRNSYLLQSKHFPLKYSLGIVSIDNYEKLRQTIGMRAQKVVNRLIAETIQENVTEAKIYRYAPDQFIIMYQKLDRKEAFQQLDNVRRTIAGTSYEYASKKKPLKLTVSCSVAEKKRSDAGAVEVLMRADKEMRKTLKFSHNVTSMG